MHSIIEHNLLIKVGLEIAQEESVAAHRTLTVVADIMSTLLVHNSAGNITNFQRLHLASS